MLKRIVTIDIVKNQIEIKNHILESISIKADVNSFILTMKEKGFKLIQTKPTFLNHALKTLTKPGPYAVEIDEILIHNNVLTTFFTVLEQMKITKNEAFYENKILCRMLIKALTLIRAEDFMNEEEFKAYSILKDYMASGSFIRKHVYGTREYQNSLPATSDLYKDVYNTMLNAVKEMVIKYFLKNFDKCSWNITPEILNILLNTRTKNLSNPVMSLDDELEQVVRGFGSKLNGKQCLLILDAFDGYYKKYCGKEVKEMKEILDKNNIEFAETKKESFEKAKPTCKGVDLEFTKIPVERPMVFGKPLLVSSSPLKYSHMDKLVITLDNNDKLCFILLGSNQSIGVGIRPLLKIRTDSDFYLSVMNLIIKRAMKLSPDDRKFYINTELTIYVDKRILDLSSREKSELKLNKTDFFNKSKKYINCLVNLNSNSVINYNNDNFRRRPIVKHLSETETRMLKREEVVGDKDRASKSHIDGVDIKDSIYLRKDIPKPRWFDKYSRGVSVMDKKEDYYFLVADYVVGSEAPVSTVYNLTNQDDVSRNLNFLHGLGAKYLYDLSFLDKNELTAIKSKELTTNIINQALNHYNGQFDLNKVVRIIFTKRFIEWFCMKYYAQRERAFIGINGKVNISPTDQITNQPFINLKPVCLETFIVETKFHIDKLKMRGEI